MIYDVPAVAVNGLPRNRGGGQMRKKICNLRPGFFELYNERMVVGRLQTFNRARIIHVAGGFAGLGVFAELIEADYFAFENPPVFA